MFSKRVSIVLVIVYVVVQLLSTMAIIALQLDARANRQAYRKQQDFIVCVLQVQPAERTDAAIQGCRDEHLN